MTKMNELAITLGKISTPTDSPYTLHGETLGQCKSDALVPNSLDRLQIVMAAAEVASVYSPMDLASFVPALSEKAQVEIKVEVEPSDDLSLQSIHTSFLLAGLVGVSERQDTTAVVLTARRKTAQAAPAVPLKKVVMDLEDDLIDEDGLLQDSSNLLKPPPSMSKAASAAGDDCGGRAPCDNCTCGRAENAQVGSAPQKTVPASSCGKCSLGDAFRCASCPYLGKPAFKAGEEHLVLDLQDDL